MVLFIFQILPREVYSIGYAVDCVPRRVVRFPPLPLLPVNICYSFLVGSSVKGTAAPPFARHERSQGTLNWQGMGSRAGQVRQMPRWQSESGMVRGNRDCYSCLVYIALACYIVAYRGPLVERRQRRDVSFLPEKLPYVFSTTVGRPFLLQIVTPRDENAPGRGPSCTHSHIHAHTRTHLPSARGWPRSLQRCIHWVWSIC